MSSDWISYNELTWTEDFLTNPEDQEAEVNEYVKWIQPGGILLIVGKTKETFQNNNFVYSGETDDTYVTVYENNYINPYLQDNYEITLLYLIRKIGKLQKYIETSLAGLFPETGWDEAFTNAGFLMEKRNLDGLYDKYLLGSGTYPLTVFIGIKNAD